MEINDIPIHNYIKTRLVNGSDLQLLCSSLHSCVIDWCDKEYNFWSTDIRRSLAEVKWLEEEVTKGFKRFTQTGLVPYYVASQ